MHLHAVLIEAQKANGQLRLAALDRRMAAHQKSFTLWRRILHYTIIEAIRLSGIDQALTGPLCFVFANALSILVYFTFDRHHRKFGRLLRARFTHRPHAADR